MVIYSQIATGDCLMGTIILVNKPEGFLLPEKGFGVEDIFGDANRLETEPASLEDHLKSCEVCDDLVGIIFFAEDDYERFGRPAKEIRTPMYFLRHDGGVWGIEECETKVRERKKG